MLRKGLTIFLLGTFCIPSAIGAVRQNAWPADQPEFADYRLIGRVIRAYSGDPEHSHYGVTLRLREARVRVLAEGRVYSVGRIRGYGNVVILDHGHGWHTLYSNLAEVRVTAGQRLRRGSVIGTPREQRLFLVVSYKGNPINPSEVMRRRRRNADGHPEWVQSRSVGSTTVVVA